MQEHQEPICFVPSDHLDHDPFNSIQVTSRIRSITRINLFPFAFCFGQFFPHFPKVIVDGIF